MMKSFLDDPGPERSRAELRRFAARWIGPIVRERCGAPPSTR